MILYCRYNTKEPVNFLVERSSEVTEVACNSILVMKAKCEIEKDLEAIAPNLSVVGSRITEDGYELVLEGPKNELEDILYFWE
jgi:hypothetical protein